MGRMCAVDDDAVVRYPRSLLQEIFIFMWGVPYKKIVATPSSLGDRHRVFPLVFCDCFYNFTMICDM